MVVMVWDTMVITLAKEVLNPNPNPNSNPKDLPDNPENFPASSKQDLPWKDMANPDMPDVWQCLTNICVTGEKLNLRLRLGITPTGTVTGTLIMVMAMADTMGATMAIAAMADITMANRFQEFQSLIYEKS